MALALPPASLVLTLSVSAIGDLILDRAIQSYPTLQRVRQATDLVKGGIYIFVKTTGIGLKDSSSLDVKWSIAIGLSKKSAVAYGARLLGQTNHWVVERLEVVDVFTFGICVLGQIGECFGHGLALWMSANLLILGCIPRQLTLSEGLQDIHRRLLGISTREEAGPFLPARFDDCTWLMRATFALSLCTPGYLGRSEADTAFWSDPFRKLAVFNHKLSQSDSKPCKVYNLDLDF